VRQDEEPAIGDPLQHRVGDCRWLDDRIAEHDFRRPADFDPRAYANRAEWQLGEGGEVAEILLSERIAWQVERHFGRYGEIRAAGAEHEHGDRIFLTPFANARMIVSWVLGLGEHARILGPPELVDELARRLALIEERHAESPLLEGVLESEVETNSERRRGRAQESEEEQEEEPRRVEAAIRPERFARLVTLASILIQVGRAGGEAEALGRVSMADVQERLQLSEEELREDIDVLNVVNFGGGSYVLYAEILEDSGEIEVDPQPYSDNFDRPARLLPVEAKALIAAIDLIGEHIPEGSLASAREKIVAALGEDPMEQGLQVAHGRSGDDPDVARRISRAIVEQRLIELDYYKENEDEFSLRRVEPYALVNGREGWYVASFDPEKAQMRHFRLDRIRRAEVTEERFQARAEVDPAANKMSVAFTLEHKPGSLVAALSALSAMGTNLTKIESRPVKGRPWEYIFYVDCKIGSSADGTRALAALGEHCGMVKELGRYSEAH